MRYGLCVAMLAALATTSCSVGVNSQGNCEIRDPVDCEKLAARLDRGDWMVNQRTRIWKVQIARPQENLPPRHAGYVIGRNYKQMRGGPAFQMYSVTTLNRNEQIGHIDSIGRATRYAPRRNLGFEEVDLGANSMTNNIAAIFDTPNVVSLEATTERQLAFEALDRNGDGGLTRDEVERYGDRIANADSNRDGKVDLEEFKAIEVL
jgi:hypothetical protein